MSSIWVVLSLSLKVALFATLINLILGVGLGFLLSRYRFLGKELLDVILTLPMVMPPTILGYYLLVMIGKNGIVGSWLYHSFGINLIFTWQAAVIAASIASFPLVFKPARAAFENIDPQLTQAASILGISHMAIFFRVTLPLAWRGILSGILLAFARSLGEFGTTLMVAGSIVGKTQTLSIAVYEAVQAGQTAMAHTLVLVSSLTCVVILLGARYLSSSANHAMK